MNEANVVALVFGDTDDSTKAVEYVFKVLAATYMTAWDRALGTAPIADIKTVWAYQLGQFTHSQSAKSAIMWGLRNLPDTPPSAIQFRNLCRTAPAEKYVELPKAEQKANPAIVAAILGGLSKPVQQAGRLEWTKNILARYAAGEKISPTVVQMARFGLGERQAA